jgi:hypothetical protein
MHSMFGTLIRRKAASPLDNGGNVFDSTTFSLSMAVPRPPEPGIEQGMMPTLRIAKLVASQGEQLMRIRQVSAGGLMGDIGFAVPVGDSVSVEVSSQEIPATVIWTREGSVGLKFDQNVDLGELLAGRKPRHGFRPRPPRLEVGCKASVKLGNSYYTVDVHDISLAGMKVEPIGEYCLGKKVVVAVESLKPIRGEVRWFSEGRAGIVFDKPIQFEALAEWVGKRLELASLKASYRSN